MGKLVDRFDNKKVLLWGYGVEGKSSEKFLYKYCKPLEVKVFEGDRKDLPIDDYDIIIKSPGVPYFNYTEEKITSMTQLFLEEFRDKTIGITGTKGKSTTTSMLYHVLSQNLNKKVCLLGNIGIPCFDAYEDMKNGAIAVYEMSCHQLANLTVSPHVAVFLNLYEDHLDYYKTKEAYFEAKAHITRFQTESDLFYKGVTVPEIETDANVVRFDLFDDYRYELNVPGIHNQWNADVAKRIAVENFGCDEAKVIKSLKNFVGLPHRLEKFATVNGIAYYDDSISTIPEATISAIESIPDVSTVIVGGMDRGIDYSPLYEAVSTYKDIQFIFCYASGKRIFDEVSKTCANAGYVEDLRSAVEEAKKITAAGSCVLSPAAASYGYFKNFEERGDYFKSCVLH